MPRLNRRFLEPASRSSLALLAVTLAVLFARGALAAGGEAVPKQFYEQLRWRFLGPHRGGWALCATGVPGTPHTFLFGAADGGVFRSDLTLVPTGAGEPRSLTTAGLSYEAAEFLPDGNRIAFKARAGAAVGIYVQDLAEGPPRPLIWTSGRSHPTASTSSSRARTGLPPIPSRLPKRSRCAA